MAGLERFTEAQQKSYDIALREIKNGRKQSHWMWYIFPQVAGLGLSSTSLLYAIKDLQEAAAYLAHPLLGKRLIEISACLLALNNKSANDIFGTADDMKLRSCMILFAQLQPTNPVFKQVLEKYFDGRMDERTLKLTGEKIK